MKQTILALLATALLAIAAGIAIAGLPSELEGGALVITAPVSTTSSSTVPAATTSVAPAVPSTVADPAPSTTESSAPPTTAAATTTSPAGSGGDTSNGQAVTTTTVFAPESLAPEELVVATANASGVSGMATATAERLRPLGYVDVTPVDSDPSATSTVYYQPGLEHEASRLAVDLGWAPTSIAPVDEMPVLRTVRSFDLVAVVGADQA